MTPEQRLKEIEDNSEVSAEDTWWLISRVKELTEALEQIHKHHSLHANIPCHYALDLCNKVLTGSKPE